MLINYKWGVPPVHIDSITNRIELYLRILKFNEQGNINFKTIFGFYIIYKQNENIPHEKYLCVRKTMLVTVVPEYSSKFGN